MEEENFESMYDFAPVDFNFIDDEEIVQDEEFVDDTDDNNDNDSIEDESPEEVDREDEDKEDDESESDDDDDSSSQSNTFSLIASFAQEVGVLSSLDLSNVDIKSPEDLKEVFDQEVAIRAKELADRIIDSADVGAIKSIKADLSDLVSYTEETFKEDINLAKKIVEQDMIEQKVSERFIKNYMRKLSDMEPDEIVAEAMSAKESLAKIKEARMQEEFERYEAEQAENLKRAEEDMKKLQATIYDNKEIAGLVLNKTVRDKIYQNITSVVGEDQYGNPINVIVKDSLEDPIGFQVRMHAIYELTNGFRNIDKLGARQKSNAVKELERSFRDGKPNYSGKASYKVDPQSYDGPLKFDTLNI